MNDSSFLSKPQACDTKLLEGKSRQGFGVLCARLALLDKVLICFFCIILAEPHMYVRQLP